MSKKRMYALWIFGLTLLLLCNCAGTYHADQKLNQKKYQEAIPLLKAYLADHPDSWETRGKLGFAYLKIGRFDKAMVELNAVLDGKPGDPYAILYLGLVHLNKGEIGKAIAIFQTYRNKEQPLVAEEIKRQITLLQIAESYRIAKSALKEEKELRTTKPDAYTIGVTNYEDLSPEKSLRAFRKALTAMVISDLSKIASLRIVERVRIQALLAEMRLAKTGLVDKTTAPRIGKLIGAKKLVIGSLALGSPLVPDSLHSVTSITSTVRGGILGSTSISIEKSYFYNLSKLIVENIGKIAGVQLSIHETDVIRKPQTKNYKAYIFYGSALDALDAGNWKQAKNFFTEALKEDPEFGLAQEGLAACPGPDSPSISTLSQITTAQLVENFESSISAATSEQSSADDMANPLSGTQSACFAYDTLVLMGDNSLKRVIYLKPGDRVKSRDMKTGKLVDKIVTNKYRGDVDHYYLINGELKITKSHPVLTEGGKWVMVAELKVGDKIASLDGLIEVRSFKKEKYSHRVYFLGVEDTHNYFVSAYGRNFFTVHNTGGGGGGGGGGGK